MALTSPYGFLAVVPPLVAILLAILTRQVHVSLLAGIYVGALILSGGHPLGGLGRTGDLLVDVFQSRGNTMVLMFCLLVGGLIALIQYSGGVEGFVSWLSRRRFVSTPKGAQLLAWTIGLVIFVESSITCLVVGAVSRPLFDRLRISREKLAYICDATSAPVCMLIPLNGWGALIIGLLAVQNVADPVLVLLKALPLTFYGIVAVLSVPVVILWGDAGPMGKAERRARDEGKVIRDGAQPMISDEIVSLSAKPGLRPRPFDLLFPVAVMVAFIPVGLYITGDGDPLRGSGSTAVFWAVSVAILAFGTALMMTRRLRLPEVVEVVLKGCAGLLSVTILLLFAFAIGSVAESLGTGSYVAGLFADLLSPASLPLFVFAATGLIAFSTGSSWGAFALMVPVAVPAAQSLEISLPLTLGAVLSGGVFGDHASPLSDTSIISSLAAASDHIDHINTQLPYALVGAAVAALLYLLFGMLGTL
jgi:tetracycline resistance efflux pump